MCHATQPCSSSLPISDRRSLIPCIPPLQLRLVFALADRSLIARLGRLIYARFVSPHRPFANPNHIIASELHLTMPWGPRMREIAGLTCSSTAHKLASQARSREAASQPRSSSSSQTLVLQSQVIVCDIRRSLVVTCLRPEPRERETQREREGGVETKIKVDR